MKKLILIIGLFLTCQILTCQTSYEFSTWLKLNPPETNQFGIAKTKKQSQVPLKITIIAVSATTLEAVGDALYDMGKGTNQNQMMAGKAFQAGSIGARYFYIPAIEDSKASWLWVPVIEAIWRFVIFDAVYNLTSGLPIGYIGNTTFWDRGMQTFAPPAGMRLFFDGIVAIFVIKLTWDKL